MSTPVSATVTVALLGFRAIRREACLVAGWILAGWLLVGGGLLLVAGNGAPAGSGHGLEGQTATTRPNDYPTRPTMEC
jgi:hypothetical protein